MILVWALVVVLEIGHTLAIPVDIFPDSPAGYESCLGARDEIELAQTFTQASAINCQRYEMRPAS